MTRVLLVYHDPDVADIEGDDLRRAGYEVDRCAGPIGGSPCPVLHGEPCWQVEKADVLLYDTYDSEFGHGVLVDDLLELHPDKPLVLTSEIPAKDAGPQHEHERRPIVAPSRSDLVSAIELALRQRPSHEVARKPMPPRRSAIAGTRW
jgi:hypothetical protein